MKRRTLILILIAEIICFFYLIVFSESGIINSEKTRIRLVEKKKHLESLKEENNRLEKSVSRLQNDEEYLKSLAVSYGLKANDKQSLIVFVENKRVSNENEIDTQSKELKRIEKRNKVIFILCVLLTVLFYVTVRLINKRKKTDDEHEES